jgi:UDP-N-acetylmuramate dehydrogenase
MKIRNHFSLKTFNSFNIQAITPQILFPTNIAELTEIATKHLSSFYVLGEGSNTLFCEDEAPIIVKPCFKGIEVNEDDSYFYVKVACTENWHEFVEFCVKNEIYGIENLALIPGSVGAAPVQNIGAYGVEVGDFIDRVSWFDFNKQELIEYSQAQCKFSYRESIFKQRLKGAGVIIHVHFKFPKNWQPVISYQGLNNFNSPVSAQDIMLKVIELRQSKLPDPKVLANAGSFFKNPLVTNARFGLLKSQYPEIPFYPQNNGEVKLAAGWLIEQAGLKGYRQGDVGVHEKQALVLINYGESTGQDIVKLAQYIQKEVKIQFGIELVTEVRFIGHQGEVDNVSAGNS